MQQYTVQITNKALDDMESIYAYIAQELQSPDNAIGQYNRIAKAIENLSVFLERIKIMDSEPENTRGIRRLSVDHYSAFFYIANAKVIVIRVLYSASDISSRLLAE